MFDIFKDKLAFLIEEQKATTEKLRREMLATYTPKQQELARKAKLEYWKLTVLQELVDYEKTKLNILALIFGQDKLAKDVDSFCEDLKQKMQNEKSKNTWLLFSKYAILQ